MELARLYTFRDVARLGSLAAAARAAGTDPSIVSRSITALEDELGVRLFERTTRRLVLTEAGDTYLTQIDPLIDALVSAQEAALASVERPRGRLKVTASSAFGQAVIAPRLKSFRERFPEVELELLLTDAVVDLLAERVDLAFRLGPRPAGDNIVARFATTTKRLVASPAYVSASAPITMPDDIIGHPCLTSPVEGRQSTWLFRQGKTALSIPVPGSIKTSNTLVLRHCARDGMGLALLADWLIADDLAAGKLISVLPGWDVATEDFESAIWIVYPSRSFLPLRTRAFIDHFRKPPS
jgi:DNA-binding transcriptional LysR family regulator